MNYSTKMPNGGDNWFVMICLIVIIILGLLYLNI